MKFDRLRASISNNAKQEPSLYMLLCMMESMIEDMEAECGADIGRCPVGDERLPSKMVWLSRVINEIYKGKDQELQRNRSRLDAAMSELKKKQQEFENHADAARKLADLKAEYAVLAQNLEDRQAAARECELLTTQCAEAKRRLEKLQSYDPVAARAELESLTAKAEELETGNAALVETVEQAKQNAATMQKKLDDLHSQNQEAQRLVDTLTQQTEQQQADAQALKQKETQLRQSHAALIEESEKLNQVLAEKQQACDALQTKIDTFRQTELAPVLSKIETAQKDILSLEKSKQETQQELEQISGSRNDLILQIARQKDANEAAAEQVRSTQNKLDVLKVEKSSWDEKSNAAVQELEKLQNEVEQLKTQKYPELTELLAQETQRQTELTEKIAEGEAQLTELCQGVQTLEEQIPKLEESLKSQREVYDSLTASYTASTKELEGLERQIAELRQNNDQEKVAIYRKQLEDNRRELEAAQAECEAIQQENQQLLQKLEETQTERDRLLEMKQKHETGNEAAAKLLRELEFVSKKDYASEVARISQRLELLEQVRKKLATSIEKLHRILGQAPIDESLSLEEQLKTQLRDLRTRADDLRCELIRCANSLNMEER